MRSAIFDLCDEYITRSSDLDPVVATMRGVADPTGQRPDGTDYGPDGIEARVELIRETLRRLEGLRPVDDRDRAAAAHLAERLQVRLTEHEAGDSYRRLSAPFGLIQTVRNSPEMMPRRDQDDWHAIARRLRAIPEMLRSWQRSLQVGLDRGVLAARRQAVEGARQADRYAGLEEAAPTYDGLLAGYGDGPIRTELEDAARVAHGAFQAIAKFLRTEYAPRAPRADGVGAERYAVGSRLSLGARIDQREAYQWGWEELHRIEREVAAEVQRLRPGGTLPEVVAELARSEVLRDPDAYRAWLQDRHDEAITRMDGVHIDLAPELRTIEATLAFGSSAGAPYYTGPSEDHTRPGRTWWPIGNRDRFETWRELTTVFHEGVPGHHLQSGTVKVAADRLSRFTRMSQISGYGEGWALYAERLADELGWFEPRGSRLGMLQASAMRAARVVIDIGLHLDLPLPATEAVRHGERWTFEVACDVLENRGGAASHRVHPEVVRYCGWPGQAPSYKLGERAWLAAREEAQRRHGAEFDLKRWHNDALNLGPIGLETLTEQLGHL